LQNERRRKGKYRYILYKIQKGIKLMSNNIISVKQIARETLPRLIDNLVFPNLIYRDAGEAMAARQGDSVLIRRPVKLEAKEFDKDDGIEMQDLAEDTVEVKLDKLATVDAAVTAWESSDDETIRRVFIEPAAAALAEKINRDGLQLYQDVWQTAGTAGEVPDGLEDLAAAAYALDVAKVPTDRRVGVWSPLATSRLKQIPAVVNAAVCGDTTALRTGSVGQIFGMENYMSQAVVHHTAGSLADLSDVTASVKSIAVNDASMVRLTLQFSAAVDMKEIKRGDVLQIGGENYCVLSNNVAFGNTMDVVLNRIFNGKAGDAVTIHPSHDANLVFHPHAFAFVTRPLSAPAGVESYVTTYNGISLRVVRGYDIRYKKEMLSMDVLYGFKTVYPELAVRYLG